MNALPLKPKVRTQILTLWKTLQVGDERTTFSIVRHVRAHTGKYIKDASIDRYLRGLRQDELLNYSYIGSKSNGTLKVIPMGETHSI